MIPGVVSSQATSVVAETNEETSWDPNDKYEQIELLNENLTALRVLDSGFYGSVFATRGHMRGRRYFECTADNIVSDIDMGVLGLGTVDAALNSYLGSEGFSAATPYSYGYYCDGLQSASGVNAGTGEAVSVGEVAGCMVDFDVGKIFSRGATGWTGDPETGAGSVADKLQAGTVLFPGATLAFATDQVTLNAGASAFAYAVPSMTLAWNDPDTETGTELLDSLQPTVVMSFSRDLMSGFAGGDRYLLNTGNVSTWYDQSGREANFVQVTGAAQPAFTTAGPNSRECAAFDGSDDLLTCAKSIGLAIGDVDFYAIFSVVIDAITTNFGSGSANSNDAIFSDSSNDLGYYLRDNFGTLSGMGAIDTASGSGIVAATNASGIVLSTPLVIEIWRDRWGSGGGVNARVNGGATATSGGVLNKFTATNIMQIGGRPGLFCQMKMFEFAVTGRVPDTTSRDALCADFMSWVGA